MITYQLRAGQVYHPKQPVRDAAYLRFIRSLPCVACLRRWGIDACHTGPHGIGQKACDMTCIPLCRRHHQEYDAAPRQFAASHGFDVADLVVKFNEFHANNLKGKAA